MFYSLFKEFQNEGPQFLIAQSRNIFWSFNYPDHIMGPVSWQCCYTHDPFVFNDKSWRTGIWCWRVCTSSCHQNWQSCNTISLYQSETAFNFMNEIFFKLALPELDEYFRCLSTKQLKNSYLLLIMGHQKHQVLWLWRCVWQGLSMCCKLRNLTRFRMQSTTANRIQLSDHMLKKIGS